jgi:hypothetical protein
MTCPKCNVTIDAEMQFCIKCGAVLGDPFETARARNKAHGVLNKVILWGFLSVPLLGFVHLVFVVFFGQPILKANMVGVAARGHDICCSIIAANEARKSARLPSIWPKTYLVTTNHPQDISGRAFMTSTEYFKVLYDEAHVGTDAWTPYLKRFDYSKVASQGVPQCPLGQTLTATNNMWLIAANITEEDSDLIPVLITRNVDVNEIERYINYGGGHAPDDTRINIGMGDYKSPFEMKAFVCVRKDASTSCSAGKYPTLRILFNSQTLPPRDPSKPKIVYLMP